MGKKKKKKHLEGEGEGQRSAILQTLVHTHIYNKDMLTFLSLSQLRPPTPARS